MSSLVEETSERGNNSFTDCHLAHCACSRILASDANRASGILQDAWLIASGRIQSFESVDHLGRWMTCVCRRRAISILRHERGTTPVAWADEPSDIGFVASPPSPVMQSADVEAAEDIQAAIERLPDTQRGAALLHFVHGRPLADVALLLGTRISAVKMRLYRARQRLREELRQYAPP